MTSRDRAVLTVIVLAALIGGFWFMALSPRRHEAAALADQVAAAQQRLDTARQTAATAEQAHRRYDGDYATVARLGKAVPVDDDMPSLVYQLEHAASRSRVDFRSIKLAAGGAATTSAPQSNPAAAAAVGKAQKDASGSTPTAVTTPATQVGAAGLPPGASVGPAGFPTMPFDFNFTGSFFSLEGFLRALDRFTVVQGNQIKVRGRLLTVDGISLSASAKGFPHMSAQIHATAYLLPADQGLTNGATPQTPASAGTAQPAATSAPGASPTPAATIGGVR